MKMRLLSFMLALGMLLTAVPSFAHHSTAMYNMAYPSTVTFVVQRCEWTTLIALMYPGLASWPVLGHAPATAPAGRAGGARVVPPARIVSSTAQPATLQAGQSATLAWATENPRGVTIDPGVGRVTPRGIRQVSP